jgi:hypothetical protein
MKRVPYSHSTFPIVHLKADARAKREKTTVSTVIHNFLIEYTKDEPDPAEHTSGPASVINTTDAAPGNPSEIAPTAVPEVIRPENISNDSESLEPPLIPETEEIEVDPESIAQSENNTAGEPVEAVHSENKTDKHNPLTEGKKVSPVTKKSTPVKPAKKAASATVKKTPSQTALKKVTPKPGIAAKKKNQAGKTKKSKAKS